MSLQDKIFDVQDALPAEREQDFNDIIEHLAWCERQVDRMRSLLEAVRAGRQAMEVIDKRGWEDV